MRRQSIGSTDPLLCVVYFRLLLSQLVFFTPGSKGSRGLKTKVKNIAGYYKIHVVLFFCLLFNA